MSIQETKYNSDDRTTDALRKRGIELYGYKKPFAGITPRIRELLLDEQMNEIGFWYIAIPHDPINVKDSVGNHPIVLRVNKDCGKPLIDAVGVSPGDPSGDYWGGHGAFAFIVPVVPVAS